MPLLNQILPNLYLGNVFATFESCLKRIHVTHVLSIGVHPLSNCPNIEYIYFKIDDEDEEQIWEIFADCNKILSRITCLCPRVCVLVHCRSAISRSPTVVAAYLISDGMPYDEMLEFLKSRHSRTHPNFGFLHQLKAYAQESI